jgi:hypothetical protein
MSQLTTVIALCGPAGSGKSTVANYLVERYGAQRYGFATPLKEMVKRALDFTDEQVYGTQEQKEAIDPRYGHSPRWFLQHIGTEGCRAVFGQDFWPKMCLDTIVRQNQSIAVIEDMRFVNESEMVLFDPRVNGFVWRLWPVDDCESAARMATAGQHASEEEWSMVHASLEFHPGKRGPEHLNMMVDEAMKMIPVRTPAQGVLW